MKLELSGPETFFRCPYCGKLHDELNASCCGEAGHVEPFYPLPPFDPEAEYAGELESGNHCHDCSFAHFWSEFHPYGMTVAEEHMFECQAKKPLDCPGVRKSLRDYLSDNISSHTLNELLRRSTSDDLLAAFVAQEEDLELIEAQRIVDAFKLYALGVRGS